MKIIVILLFFCGITSNVQCRGVNGGMSCAVCTVVSSIVMQMAEIHGDGLVNSTMRLCKYLPNFTQTKCMDIVLLLEKIGSLSSKLTPDMFCFLYGTCIVDEGQDMCHLFPLPFQPYETKSSNKHKSNKSDRIDVCQLPLLKDICEILNNSFKSLDAAQDFDRDGFSLINPVRGADWKGRDCMDYNSESYPGRKPSKFDRRYDSNCNGVWGWSKNFNKTWEELLCHNTGEKGIIYIGDSVGAHFHMPEAWINPMKFSWTGFNSTYVILDELDWPQYGFATGFRKLQPNALIEGYTDSLYLKLRKRNRCNHRDYQNLSQNGANSFDGIRHAEAITRNQSSDKPALVIYAMVGNDVCNNLKDTIPQMTKPIDFEKNVLRTLKILDGKLPKGSHVVLVGLVKADFIYSQMSERLHPIGKLHKNVKYKDLYKWFNCMEIGPCVGWLNSNESLRRITSEHAERLTNILINIAGTRKYKHFSVHFIKNPINAMSKKVHVPYYLEAAESLHPNQKAQPILADIAWNYLENLPLDVLGPVNKNNQLIKKMFGNQGGH